MQWFRRDAHLTEADLSSYVVGELAPARRARLEEHLQTCESCSAVVTELLHVKSLVSRLPQLEPSRSFVLTPEMAGALAPGRPAPRRPYALAPAVALTILVALLVVDFGVRGGSSQNQATSAPAVALSRESAPVDSSAGAQTAPQAAAPALGQPAPEATPENGNATAGGAQAGTDDGGKAAGGAYSFAPVQPDANATPSVAQAPAPAVAPAAAPASSGSGGEGPSLLRLLEVVTAGVLVLSTLLVFGPRVFGKGS